MKGERLDLIPSALQARVDHTIKSVQDHVRAGKELSVTAVVGDAHTGDCVVIPMQGTDARSKDAAVRRVRLTAQLMGATFALIVSEAWMAKGTKDQPLDRQRYKQIKDVPGRKDVVMFQLETQDGAWSGTADIPAHKGRAPRYFEAPAFLWADTKEGRMSGLLSVPDVPKH